MYWPGQLDQENLTHIHYTCTYSLSFTSFAMCPMLPRSRSEELTVILASYVKASGVPQRGRYHSIDHSDVYLGQVPRCRILNTFSNGCKQYSVQGQMLPSARVLSGACAFQALSYWQRATGRACSSGCHSLTNQSVRVWETRLSSI